MSLGESRVDIKPHQVSVVHRVISDYPHRFLLCDEVGLGKTIEAGDDPQGASCRGGAASRTLVIAPPNLIRQWQFELKSKFNETFSIINSDTVRYLRTTQGYDGNPFDAFDSVIVSSAWIAATEWAKLAAEVDWDMVIVDEAHHARVRRSAATARGDAALPGRSDAGRLPDAFSKRAALFLTATPMQLDSGELYSLIELLDPALFPTEEHFDRAPADGAGPQPTGSRPDDHGFPLPDDDPSEIVARSPAGSDISEDEATARLRGGEDIGQPALRRAVGSAPALRGPDPQPQEDRRRLHAPAGAPVGGRTHRRRSGRRSTRSRTTCATATPAADRTNDIAVGFVMVIFQKLMASSIRALRTSLDRRRASAWSERAAAPGARRSARRRRSPTIEDGSTTTSSSAALLDEVAAADAEEAAELEAARRAARRSPDRLEGRDARRAAQGARSGTTRTPKVLLFTEFRETQEYLRERLEAIGWDVQLFHGQLKPEAKDAAVDASEAVDEPSILLSTEAGGEGRNFQFCHLLVNYDLPWNPMRVEQRIGRVDRIGQTTRVQVFNFWVKGTIEERVLDVLERRINIFEETVGGLDPILGDTETRPHARSFSSVARNATRALAQVRGADSRSRSPQARDGRGEAARLHHGDQELLQGDRSPIARGRRRRSAPADQELFVSRLLADVNTYLTRQADGTYEITFHEPFVSDYPAAHEGRGTQAHRRVPAGCQAATASTSSTWRSGIRWSTICSVA